MEALACPHCDAAVQAGPATVVDCPACDRSFLTPGAEGGAASPTDLLGRAALRHPSDVGALLPGALGLAATVLFYLTVVPALGQSYAAALFAERGWVPYVIALFAFWGLTILVLKARGLRQRREELARDLLLDGDRTPLDAAAAARTRPELETLRAEHPQGLLLARVELAMELVEAGRSPGEVVSQLGTHAQADADAIESSYTLVRVFVWAIPILGFIGTVLGIGAAVSGFSSSVAAAVDLDVMKESIGSVTTGLAIAFDTTLLALVVSIALMLPASMLQKAEEDVLAGLDAFVARRIVRRLSSRGDSVRGDAPSPAAVPVAELGRVVERLDRSIASLEQQLAGVADSRSAAD